MIFGRKANLPSALATTSSLTHQELLDIWNKPHEEYVEKGKAAIRKTQEWLKRQQENFLPLNNTVIPGDQVFCRSCRINLFFGVEGLRGLVDCSAMDILLSLS